MTRAASLALVLAGCVDALEIPDDRAITAMPASVPDRADNIATADKVELGRLLFWDPILSGDRDVACATCHHPDFAYADGRDRSIGTTATPTPRNSMTILNVAFNGETLASHAVADSAPMFWDNRAASLEEQALLPIQNLDEMRGESFAEGDILPEIERRLAEIPDYVERFARAFGPDSVTAPNLARAIAAFERTLVTGPTSFDRFIAGDDTALSHAAKRGLAAFVSDGCSRCHAGPMLSDFALHSLNVPGAGEDLAADGTPRMRTPSLRNVMLTAPYMRNGSLATLADVLDFYSTTIDTSLDPLFPDRFAQREVSLIGPFFEALSDRDFDRTIPPAVPSGLVPGGSR